MKTKEMLQKWPARFLVWNLNEDTGILWTELTTLEDNGFFDPWGQKIALKGARRVTDRLSGDVVEYHIETEFQDYPVELIVTNE